MGKIHHLYSSNGRRDIHDVFDRPTRKSRPRTKDRPTYDDAEVGRVITVDRGRFLCQIDQRRVIAKKARELGRRGVIVGDLVKVVGDTSGAEGSLARIVAVEERNTVLRRTADDQDPSERPIVANADQVMVVTALANPEPNRVMIDRVMVAASTAKITPLVCFTKSDLTDSVELVDFYRNLSVPVVVTEPDADLDPVRRLLAGHVTVLVGSSGVGKSTLINSLVPGADRRTSEVSEATGKGRHTSTSAEAIELPTFEGHSGWVIDTPGVRSFGLNHVEPQALLEAFPELVPLARQCPRGCRHLAGELDCVLDSPVAAAHRERILSFRSILAGIRTLPYRN